MPARTRPDTTALNQTAAHREAIRLGQLRRWARARAGGQHHTALDDAVARLLVLVPPNSLPDVISTVDVVRRAGGDPTKHWNIADAVVYLRRIGATKLTRGTQNWIVRDYDRIISLPRHERNALLNPSLKAESSPPEPQPPITPQDFADLFLILWRGGADWWRDPEDCLNEPDATTTELAGLTLARELWAAEAAAAAAAAAERRARKRQRERTKTRENREAARRETESDSPGSQPGRAGRPSENSGASVAPAAGRTGEVPSGPETGATLQTRNVAPGTPRA